MADSPQVLYPEAGLEVNHRDYRPWTMPHYAHEESASMPSKGATTHEVAIFNKDTSIFGLRRQSFWFFVTLAVIVVAAAVGGGIGGSMAVRNAQCKASLKPQQTNNISPEASTSTSNVVSASPTIASSTGLYVPLSPTAVARVDNSCPVSNGILLSVHGDTFSCLGNRDAGGNNLAGFVSYTLQTCIDACSTFNIILTQGGTKCVGIVMSYDFKRDYLTNNGANCWLKSRVDSSNILASEYGTVAILSG